MNFSNRSSYIKYFYTFMIGFLICLLVQFYLQDKFERQFFESISRGIFTKRNSSNEDSSIVSAMHVTHTLLSNRSAAFNDNSYSNFDIYNGSLSNDLLTSKGACGSYAAVLANLLETMGFDTRIIQMKVNNVYGGHIINEVSTKKGWVVLDAMYDLSFITPAGMLASFTDVSGNWDYYKKQTPNDYNNNYKYQGFRYTNWEKIPVVMPALKKIITMSIGEKRTNAISIRPLFLRKYRVYCIAIIILLIIFSVQLYKKIRSTRSEQQILSIIQEPQRVIKSRRSLGSIFNFKRSHSRSRQFYYKSFIAEVGLQPLLDCHNNNGMNAQHTSIDILGLNLPFNSNKHAMKVKLGGPKFTFKSNSGNMLHDIYFYAIDIYHKKAIAQFHYFDKKYFLCNLTFTDTDHEEKNNILDILSHKYCIETHTNEKQISVDREGNLLMVDNSVNLNICYMNNNSDIIRALDNQTPMNNIKSSKYHLSNLKLEKML